MYRLLVQSKDNAYSLENWPQRHKKLKSEQKIAHRFVKKTFIMSYV